MSDSSERKIRVLHVLKINGLVFGGIERMLLNWYRNINRKKYEFHVVTPALKSRKSFKTFSSEIEKLGGRCYSLGIERQGFLNYARYRRALKKFIENGDFDIVHINSGAFFFVLQVAIAAWTGGAKKIIFHSHSIAPYGRKKKILMIICRPFLDVLVRKYLYCSKKAGENVFGKRIMKSNKAEYIPNGINLKDFVYSAELRSRTRKILEIKDSEIVYGHLGRFYEEKNHVFLIDVFYEISKLQSNSKLILVGEGELEDEIRKKVKSLGLEKKVLFVGHQDDARPYLCAMDYFIFPSIFEGLGIAGIEAQASGLPIFYSKDVVPDDVKILKESSSLPLEKGSQFWAKEIVRRERKIDNREECVKIVADAGYDIANSTRKLEKVYEELVR